MPTHYNGSPEIRLALDTYIKLTRANSAFEARMLSHGDLGHLTISQFGVLEVLYHLGPQCQGALSQKLLKSTGNMTLVLDNLEKRKLVTAQPQFRRSPFGPNRINTPGKRSH
jgi:MarR family transcriptional regulator, 2-MHQ and catechol-resistance regulon repressor